MANTQPYEFLARFKDGALVGAHVIFADTTNPTYPVLLPAQPIAIGEQAGFPLSDILGELHVAALKQVEETQQRCDDAIAANAAICSAQVAELEATHETSYQELQQQCSDALAANAATHSSEVSTLQASHELSYQTLQQEHEGAIAQLNLSHDARLSVIAQEHEATIAQLNLNHAAELKALSDQLEALLNPPVKWSQFRVAMMSDAAYDRFEATLSGSNEGTRLLIKLTAIVMADPPNVPVLQAVWNAAFEIVEKPTAEEIANWNAIATAANVPLSFGSSGLIEL